MSSLGVSKVWYLYRLSTRTNQRAVYFFCQKYYKSRNSAETLFTEKTLFTGIRRNSTIHQTFGHSVSSTSKTEIPLNSVKHYSPKYFSTTRKLIRQLRITFFSQPKHYLGEKPRKRENRLPNWSDRFDISEISDFLSTPPPLFIGILRRFAKDRNALGLHKITYMPLSG
jgi:hypothetical protein